MVGRVIQLKQAALLNIEAELLARIIDGKMRDIQPLPAPAAFLRSR